MAEFNSYLLGKARKSVGNLTIVYAKGKNLTSKNRVNVDKTDMQL